MLIDAERERKDTLQARISDSSGTEDGLNPRVYPDLNSLNFVNVNHL